MKKGFILSAILHLTVIAFFAGMSIVFPSKPIPQSKVILDVDLAVSTKNITKKRQVKKTKKNVSKKAKIKPVRKKIIKKKVLKPKKKIVPKRVKKKILKPVKKVTTPKPKVTTPKLKVSTLKPKVDKKTIENKKNLKTLNPVKQVITDKVVKKNTTIKKEKPKKIINDVSKDTLNKSKNKVQDGRLNKDDLIAFRNQIKQCWNVPAGVQDAKNLVTKITITASLAGKVDSAKIHWTSKSMNDPFMKVMAESALRAILSEYCSPLKLPKEKYKQWREIIITFDPKDML